MTEERKTEVSENLARRRKVRARDAARRIAALKAGAASELAKFILGSTESMAGSCALIDTIILERRRACAEGYSVELERALKS